MKVSDLMQKTVIKVNVDDPLKYVARIIFSLGISTVPIVKKNKLVGVIYEEDILQYQDSKDFLNLPIRNIMNKKPFKINQTDKLLKAQEIMLSNKLNSLLVVNNTEELVGIISLEDIFKELFKDVMSNSQTEKYADYIAKSYDLMVDWNSRFDYELPVLFNEFRKHKVNSLIDIGVWTGEYTLKLASEGVKNIIGLDNNPSMIKISQGKLKQSPILSSKNVKFALTDFSDLKKTLKGSYDAAICMGNSLPYLPIDATNLFRNIAPFIKSGGTIFLQILNINKVLKKNGKLLSFVIQPSEIPHLKEHLFLELVQTTKDEKKLDHNVVVFDNDGKNWTFNSVTTVPIYNYSVDILVEALTKAGFTNITLAGNNGEYQGGYGQLTFNGEFDEVNNDWLNIKAVKK